VPQLVRLAVLRNLSTAIFTSARFTSARFTSARNLALNIDIREDALYQLGQEEGLQKGLQQGQEEGK
jgi:predicted transposase YdaD